MQCNNMGSREENSGQLLLEVLLRETWKAKGPLPPSGSY
jgi:hypothetical protein